MARKKKVKEDILITGIADKGMGVGRDEEGMVYFVEGPVPGDVVDVLVLRKKSSYRKGVVQQYKELSPERVEAKCKHFGACGGCKWQNLDYSSQLKYKEQSVKDAFKRIAHIEAEDFQDIVGCDEIYAYRNKMEYSFSYRRWATREELDSGKDIDFGQAVGFHRAGSFDKVVQIDQCQLQDDLSNRLRNFVHAFALERNWTYYNSREHHGFLRNMRVRNTSLGEWMIVMIFGENKPDEIKEILEALKDEFPQLNSIQYIINTKMNDSVHDLDATESLVSLPITTRCTFFLLFLKYCPAAIPIFRAYSAVIGNSLTRPRMPSVPKYFFCTLLSKIYGHPKIKSLFGFCNVMYSKKLHALRKCANSK